MYDINVFISETKRGPYITLFVYDEFAGVQVRRNSHDGSFREPYRPIPEGDAMLLSKDFR